MNRETSIFSSWMWPAAMWCNSPMARAATSIPTGLQMASISFFHRRAAGTRRFTAPWPTGPYPYSNSLPKAIMTIPFGAGPHISGNNLSGYKLSGYKLSEYELSEYELSEYELSEYELSEYE